MKRIQMFIAPLLSLAFLASCGGGHVRPEEVTFFMVDDGTAKIENTEAIFQLTWEPSNHSISLSNFTFKGEPGPASNIEQEGEGTQPNPVTITSDVSGEFGFVFDDATAKIKGQGQVLITISN